MDTPEIKTHTNDFIELPNHLESSINKVIYKHLDKKNIKKILDKFRSQYPEISEKSYKLLQNENKLIGKNFGESFKEESELSELVNYSFFKTILEDIQKENTEIQTIKIYNTYGYTDRKTGVDYTVFLKLKSGLHIAFGIDLKNGRNAEENYNQITDGKFTLITQDYTGKIENYENIRKNIEQSKNFYNNISKQKRKYEIGINPRNQVILNEIILKEILKPKAESEIKKLNIYNYIKEIIKKIVKAEIETKTNGVKEVIDDVKNISENILLEELKLRKEEKEKKERAKKERKKREEKIKKEKEEKIKSEKIQTKKRKYEIGKNYTKTKYREDLLFLSDMKNKSNISFKLKQIAQKIKSNKKLKEDFNKFYKKSIEENSFKFEMKKNTYRLIENPKKTFLNRFKKLYDLINQD